MQTRTITYEENDYVFVLDFKSTRNGFAHLCTITRNGSELAKAKCNYINRTWEPYPYYSVMCKAIDKIGHENVKAYLLEVINRAR